MALSRTKVAAVGIDGIGTMGDQSGSTPKMYLFGTGLTPELEGADTQWVRALVNPPQGTSMEINPLTGELRSSKYAPIMHHREAYGNRVDLASIFLSPAATADGNITVDASPTGNVTLDRTDLTDYVIFVGVETIHLVSHLGSGEYTTARGLYNSPATSHAAGTAYYFRPPFFKNRGVAIYDVDRDVRPDQANIDVSWRGYLLNAPRTNSDGTTIQFDTQDVPGGLSKATVGLVDTQIRSTHPSRGGDATIEQWGRNPEDKLLYGMTEGFIPTSRKVLTAITDTGTGSGAAFAFQVNEAVTCGVWDTNARLLFPAVRAMENSLYSEDDQPMEKLDKPARELFAVSKELDAWALSQSITPPSPTYNLDYPYHPLSVAAVIIHSDGRNNSEDPSTFDMTGGNWSMGLQWAIDLTSIAAWQTMIEATPGIQIDHFYMGWDGEREQVWDRIVKQLMIPFGFFPVFNDEGRIVPKQLRLMTIDDLPNLAVTLDPIPPKKHYKGSFGTVMDEVFVTLGSLPWMDNGRRVAIDFNSDQGWTNAAFNTRISDIDDYEVDLTVYRYDRDEEIIAFAGDLGVFRAFVMPWYEFDVNDSDITGQTYELGEMFQIGDLDLDTEWGGGWFIDKDGNRLDDVSSDRKFVGMQVGWKRDYVKHTYSVDLMMTNFQTGQFVRYRAPSAQIFTILGGNQYGVNTTSVFGADASDAAGIDVGMELLLVDGNGAYKAGGAVEQVLATNPGAGTVTLTGNFGGTIAVTDFLVLAGSDYDLPSGAAPSEDREFAYLSDVNDEIDVNVGAHTITDPDIYG